MRSFTSLRPARRARRLAERRTKRRPAILAVGLATGLAVTVGFAGFAPAAQAEPTESSTLFVLASVSAPALDVAAEATETTESSEALAAATASLNAAETVAADIAASGLDVGVPVTTVDTTELAAVVEQLDAEEELPMLLETALTNQVTELVAPVDEQVASLRGSLDAAIAWKAEQEAAAAAAAEQARLEAEAAAAAAAEEAAKAETTAAAPAPVFASGGVAGDNSPAGAQASARAMLSGYGWGDDQFGCLVSLWNKESGWNYLAHNASSGAHGIPQALPGSKMGSAGADWQTNAATQVAWGLGYIAGRYGNPCGAWSHSQSVGWY
ncbi:hypothetical protein QL996_04540 [Planococcus sp. APC 4015]|nr:hypothetical protein [Planococcus sp. APC 4015]